MENPHSILKKVFGYDSFRPGQEDIVRRLLDGQDVLAVMPTGAGKSVRQPDRRSRNGDRDRTRRLHPAGWTDPAH